MKTLQLKIPQPIEEIIDTLSQYHEVYFVGGCVRDLLLHRPIHDYDCATSATVDEMKKVLSQFKIIESGIQHGTLTILNDSYQVEITTYRIEKEYINHRTPKNVCFTRNIHEDLKRRDFTINALAYSKNGHLIDDHNGLNDLKNKIIRCVGNPTQRFNEDALRMLRAIRFSCTLHFSIEEETNHAIHQQLHLLNKISVERKFEELSKILTANQDIYGTLEKYNLFSIFNIPYSSKMKTELNQSYNDLEIRIANCFYSPNDVKDTMKSWHVSNKTIDDVLKLVEYRNIELVQDDYTIRKLIYKHGIDFTKKILLFKKMDLEIFNKIVNTQDYLIKLAINGKDCITLGYTGESIQIILNDCIEYVLHDLNRNNKKELIKRISSKKIR